MLKGGLKDSGKELLRSMQRMASTIAGESSLAVSERVSLGSKLKESKMSGYSGYDSGGQRSNNKQTLHKFKSDPELMTTEAAQKL